MSMLLRSKLDNNYNARRDVMTIRQLIIVSILLLVVPAEALSQSACKPNGFGATAETSLAKKLCDVSVRYGLNAQEVMAFGNGEVDIGVSNTTAEEFLSRPKDLQKITSGLVEWIMANDQDLKFVQLSIGILGPKNRGNICRARKIRGDVTKITFYGAWKKALQAKMNNVYRKSVPGHSLF